MLTHKLTLAHANESFQEQHSMTKHDGNKKAAQYLMQIKRVTVADVLGANVLALAAFVAAALAANASAKSAVDAAAFSAVGLAAAVIAAIALIFFLFLQSS